MKRFVSALVVLGLVVNVYAAEPRFIQSKTFDAVTLLPPPPATDSQEATTELEVVLKLQATRSAADVARAKEEATLTPAAFQTVLGADFTSENLPKLFALLEDAGKDFKTFSTRAKDHFARPRPPLADSHVQPVIEGETDPGYPSGHATRGMLWALILCEIFPDKHDALLRRGQEIGWDRVVAGVHYPSDVYSARVLGQAVAQAMERNAEFQDRLAKAKEEFDAFSKARPTPRPLSPVSAP